ncbi:MAG: CRISPR-associated endonuclease Cas1 [Nitrososphaerales archaeon]
MKIAYTTKVAEENELERLVIDGYGKYIGRKGDRIVVKEEGKIVAQALPEELRQVLITGHGAITFDALNLLAKNGVDVILIDRQGELTTRLSPPELRTVLTRREQYYAYKDRRGLILSKEFVLAKLKNQYSTLGTLAKRRKDSDANSSDKIYEKRKEISLKIQEIEQIDAENIDSVRSSIMSVEGIASMNYWSAIMLIIPEEFGFKERSGRYASDPINAMLNYGYGILEGEVWRAIHFAGLDPYGGFLHVDKPGKPSLVLDLMEEFRQQIIDKSIIKLVSRKEVKPEDFSTKDNLCFLEDRARRTLLKEILERFEDCIAIGEEKIRWCDLILNQARKIGKFLRGEIPSYEGFWLRW